MMNRWYSEEVNNVRIKGHMPTACHSLLACKLYAVVMTTRAIKGRNPDPKFISILPSQPKRHAGTSTPKQFGMPLPRPNDRQIQQVPPKDNRPNINIRGKPDPAFNGILARRPLHLLLLLRSGR